MVLAMKPFAVLLVAGLQLVAGLPQHDHGTATGDHDHGTPATSVSVAPQPSGTGAAPAGCKIISTDSGFPNLAAVQATLPGTHALEKSATEPRPDYHFAPKTYAEVQAAVKFAAKHNIRLSLLNSGHDFLGRYEILNRLY